MDGFREEKEMKKLYKKPVLYVERFTVDENFAKNCGADEGSYGFGDAYSCIYLTYFLDSNVACEDTITEDQLGTECYDGNFNIQVFAS